MVKLKGALKGAFCRRTADHSTKPCILHQPNGLLQLERRVCLLSPQSWQTGYMCASCTTITARAMVESTDSFKYQTTNVMNISMADSFFERELLLTLYDIVYHKN